MGSDGEATSAVSRPGNRDDFDRLYRENYPRLLRTLYAITGDAAAAEDCVQEAFVKAWRAWPRFRPERAPEGWLHQIAVNTAISYRRRAKLRSVGFYSARHFPEQLSWLRRRDTGAPAPPRFAHPCP